MRIGPYSLATVNDGEFALDGGAMFGTVPRILWERVNPPDEKNRISMALRTLLIRGEGRTILVDTGIGDKWSEKHLGMYRIERRPGGVPRALEKLGVAAEAVTDVVLSHLHFDHAGGATQREASGKLLPTYPRARVHVQRSNFDSACCPNERERASYLAENVRPLEEAGVLRLHEGEFELAPGIRILVSNGHTRAMQMVRVSSAGDPTVLYPADLIPTSAHLKLPWLMGYDLFPLTIIEEKKALLSRAVEEGWVLVFEHDPRLAASRVRFDGKDYAAAEAVEMGDA